MWLGYANDSSAPLMTNAHFDGTDNLFVVLSGQKTFYLWDPSSARGMYTYAPVARVSPSGHMTLGSPPNRDLPRDFINSHVLKRSKTAQVPILRSRDDPYVSSSGRVYTADELRRLFPLYFENTTRAVCEVRAGDAIYFPGCFFHEVHSSGGRHLGINFWMMYQDDPSIDLLPSDRSRSRNNKKKRGKRRPSSDMISSNNNDNNSNRRRSSLLGESSGGASWLKVSPSPAL